MRSAETTLITAIGIVLGLARVAAAAEPTLTLPGVPPRPFIALQEMIAERVHGLAPSGAADVVRERSNSCGRYYRRMFSDGELSAAIGLGWWDPAVDGNSPNDRFYTIVNNLTRPCREKTRFACGFVRHDSAMLSHGNPIPGTQFVVLIKPVQFVALDGTKTETTVRVSVCNPYLPETYPEGVRENQRRTCASLFAQSVKYDDVSMYIGHSRYGGGPDFWPPVLAHAHADPAYYLREKEGVDRFLSVEALQPTMFAGGRANPVYKQLYLLSCSSESEFGALVRRNATLAGYGRDGFDLVGTDRPSMNDGTEPLQILEAMGRGECAAGIRQAYDHRIDNDDWDISMTEGLAPPGFEHLDTRRLYDGR